MLKYIVGGMALIAVGYGLAKYAEDYGIFDEVSEVVDTDDSKVLSSVKVQSESESSDKEEA